VIGERTGTAPAKPGGLQPREDDDERMRELLPTRRARANPRVVKRRMSIYRVEHPHHRSAPIIGHRPVIIALK